MSTISVIQSTKLPSKRRVYALRILPTILGIIACSFVVFPGCCTSLKPTDGTPFWSLRNNRRRNIGFRRSQCSIESATLTRTRSKLPSSASPHDTPCQDEKLIQRERFFQTHRPLLAIITETDACDTDEKMKYTYETVKKATSTGKVDLVSVRLSLPPPCDENGDKNKSYHGVLKRARRLTKELVALSMKRKEDQQRQSHDDDDKQPEFSFAVVCSSDLVSVAVDARANGVHVKEHHLDRLPDIVDRFDYPIVIGTSTHSIESALKSYFSSDDEDEDTGGAKIQVLKPHYYFVGTCYLTASHPEKILESQLEGPELPGRVKRALQDCVDSKEWRLPRIMAIGGIDETNCHEPIALGADGVAVIRAVLQADRPVERVEDMQASMMRSFEHQQ